MKTSVFIVAGLLALSASAVEWKGIGPDSWIAGPHIKSPESLRGKVVLVDVWGYRCPPCKALLPRMEELWESYHSKPFVLIGSHRQARNEAEIKTLVDKFGLKYPIYQGAGLAEDEPSSGGAIPFMYVVNHRGKVVYSGRSHQDATEALVTAIGEVGRLPSLTEGVYLVKHKNLEKQLVLGKPIKAIVSKLEAEANGKNAELATEAGQILKAIEHALAEIKEEIDFQKEANPKEALKLIKLMKVTWPKEAEAAYKADVPALIRAAKERDAAEKAAKK